mmetsp:Transcript_54620/g.130334  ORF Transcript_54620/g.130334 Transcript_54620/m.130334 type:complete len:229 (+) Transcript_54620:75-761(+)
MAFLRTCVVLTLASAALVNGLRDQQIQVDGELELEEAPEQASDHVAQGALAEEDVASKHERAEADVEEDEGGPAKQICSDIDEYMLYNSNNDRSGPVKLRPGQLWYMMSCKRSRNPFKDKTHDIKVKVISRGRSAQGFVVVDTLEAEDVSEADLESIGTRGIPMKHTLKDPSGSLLTGCSWNLKGQFGSRSFGKLSNGHETLKFDAFRSPPSPKELTSAPEEGQKPGC